MKTVISGRSGWAVVAAVGVVASSGAVAQSPDAGAILDRAVAAYAQVTTLRADFSQTVHDPMIGADDSSRGEYLQQRPKFAIRWRRPSGDMIVSDGRTMWVYTPSSQPGQVIRQDLTGRPGESGDFLAQFLDRPKERFTAEYERAEGAGGRPADVLALTARDRNAPYRTVRIWVDRQDALVRRIEIVGAAGDTRRIVLDRLRVNQPVPAASFVFRPPAGARVVDATH
jgi:outer membrane lipoprotein carrier protein